MEAAGDVLEIRRAAHRARERPGRAGKNKGAVGDGVVERLDSEAVAHQPEGAIGLVEDCQGEHAVQPSEGVRAPLPKGLEDDLGVALGLEPVAQVRELGPDLEVVVDLAVVDGADPVFRVPHRLVACRREVDDAQPVVPKEGARPLAADLGDIGVIRSAVVLRFHRRLYKGAGVLADGGRVPAGDTTHG